MGYVIKKSILLVEDNPDDRLLTVRALKNHRLGNNIKTVEDGREALDYLFGQGEYQDRDTREQPEVVLLDLKLPKIDGLGVLKQMRENKHTQHVPVVILTSSTEESDMVTGYDLGANSYIVKPVDFNKFIEAVGQLGLYWLVLNKTVNV